MRGRLLLGLIAVIVLITGCASSGDAAAVCEMPDGETAIEAFDRHTAVWDDAVVEADSTPRISLIEPIQELERIRADVADDDWPDCAGPAITALLGYMDATIEAFWAFVAVNEPLMEHHLADADEHIETYQDAYRQLNAD